jgi:maltose alpha-D-glucosyltransferase/alpha-amylase
LEFIKPENRAIFAFIRRYKDDLVLCVFNLSRHAQPTELDLRGYEGCVPVEMSGGVQFPLIGQWPYQLSLNGYGFFWFALKRE